MKKYLIHITLAGKDIARNREMAAKITAKVKTLSAGQHKLLYCSADCACFGWFAASAKPAHHIRTAIDGNNLVDDNHRPRNPQDLTGLENGDKVMVVELGEDMSENGFSAFLPFLRKA